jgi:hypothetical protein
MAFIPIDGNVKVSWATSISNIAAPTTSELNAGTALESKLTADGLDITVSTGGAGTSVAGSRYSTERAARVSFKGSLKFHHDGSADTPWTTLTLGTLGYLVVRLGIASTTAWTASQKVAVYPVECGEFDDEAIKENGSWDFTVPLFLTSDMNQRAVVA